MSELLPCPFCGGEAYIHAGALYCWGKCKRCGAESTTATSVDKAGKAWNTRATSAVKDGKL